MCSRKVFGVTWAVWLSVNFEFDFGVIVEEKCKAIPLVRKRDGFRHASDW
jgi:hypothetical protein